MNKQSPLVSVLMPVYNGEKYLAEAIESILNQTFVNLEFLIINDGSTDRSLEIINSFVDSRIVLIDNASNKGLIYSLNRGIALAQGRYIARMDADDVSNPLRIERQIAFLEAHPDVGYCGTWARKIDASGNVLGCMRRLTQSEPLRISLLFSSPYIHPTMVIKSELLKKYCYDKDFKHVEDFELWTRLSVEAKGINIPSFLLSYRWHGDNISVKQNTEQGRTSELIVTRSVEALGLQMTHEEYLVHISTIRIGTTEFDFKKLRQWFNKLLMANSTQQRYDQNVFKALLWSRWIVAVIRSRRWFQLLNFGYPYSFKIGWNMFRMLRDKR